MEKSAVKDMTAGSPFKLILGFAVPMLLGYLFQQFYTMADSMIVGRFVGEDALAAIGVALDAGIEPHFCIEGLARFGGVGRRFEHKGEKNDILVVDDYGHHPVEIAATLATARTAYPDRRVVVAFQPHRFSRTQALFGEFCHVLGTVDKLLLTEIYPASEKPIPGVNGQNLAQGIRQVSDADVSYFQNFDEMVAALPDILKPGDLFLTIGAGNVTTVGPRFLALE